SRKKSHRKVAFFMALATLSGFGDCPTNIEEASSAYRAADRINAKFKYSSGTRIPPTIPPFPKATVFLPGRRRGGSSIDRNEV
ncbi:hypothetical protein, partial [Polaromonas jejuensis]|uniref:hypothetical protein n=1 Tax=Polaromonas jejuensis TaxID=457502 RepID=UPI001C3FBA8E